MLILLLPLLLPLAQIIDVNPGIPTWYPWSASDVGTAPRFQGNLGNRFVFRMRTGLGSNPPGYGQAATKESLWVSDGTALGSHLIAQIGPTNPGLDSSVPRSAALPNGDLVLNLSSTKLGDELFVLDQATESLRLLIDVVPGPESPTYYSSMEAWGGKVWIAAQRTGSSRFLCTDGTAAGTLDIQLPVPAPIDSSARFVPAGNRLFLAAGALFVLDTPQGTWQTVPLIAGQSGTFPLGGLANGKLVFVASTPSTGREPWVTDGTLAGTLQLEDIEAGAGNSNPGFKEGAGGRLYFSATSQATARELWATDGTPQETYLLADVGPGQASGIDSWKLGSDVQAVPGGIYFTAYDLDDANGFLWFSDGTPLGTVKVPNQVLPQMPSGTQIQSWSLRWTGSDLLAFISKAPALSLDPNPALVRYPVGGGAPHLISTTTRVNAWLEAIGSKQYFIQSNASSSSTLRLSVIENDVVSLAWQPKEVLISDHSDPKDLVREGGRGLFIAHTNASGSELRTIEAASGSLGTVYEVHFGALDAKPQLPFGETANGSVFSGYDNFFGQELRIAKDPQQPWPLLEITPGSASTAFSPGGASIHGIALFSVTSPTARGGWRSNGTDTGSFLLGPTAGAPPSFEPGRFARFQGRVWFPMDGQLVACDGSQITPLPLPAGTTLPVDSLVATAGGQLLFEVGSDGPNTSRSLWVTDGSPAGTHFLWDLAPGPDAALLGLPSALGDLLVFRATTPAEGQVVCRTDGTPFGSFLLADPVAGAQGAVLDLVVAGDRAFFLGQRPGDLQTTLWVSDGTLAGTQPVTTGPAEVGGLIAEHLFPLGRRRVAFVGLSLAAGSEPWVSDGTVAGTGLLADLEPGPGSSYPTTFKRIGPWIFCDVLDPELGRELYRLPFSLLGTDAVDALGADSYARLRPTGGQATPGSQLLLQADELDAGTGVALLIDVPANAMPIDGDVLSYLVNPQPLVSATADSKGVADFSLALSNNPGLVGREVFLQALAVDIGGPLFGFFSVSNPVDVFIGP